MNLLRNLAWEEVFLEWYKNEGDDPGWAGLAKERGYATWADWRINGFARRFECANATWGLYEIENPSEVVGGWFGGPFRTWIERYYDGEKTKSFAEIITTHPPVGVQKVQSIVDHYPSNAIISALQLPDNRTFVIEGMHRACALARLAAEGRPYPGKLIFAIGESALAELPAVGKNG